MRSHRTPLAVLLVLGLATLAKAEARSASDAGADVAPGVSGRQQNGRAISDGSGGAYVVFQAITCCSPYVAYSVIARIGPDGLPDPAWNVHTVTGYIHFGNVTYPMGVATAGSGKAWLFADLADPGYSLYGLIHSDWPQDPDLDSTASNPWSYTQGTTLDGERTLVEGFTHGVHATLRVGVLTTTSSLESSANNISLTGDYTVGGDVSHTTIADGAGGAWSVVSVQNIFVGSDLDVVAVRYGADGSAAWSPPSRVVTSAARRQEAPSICGDGAGGAFITWADNRDLSTSYDVYAMHMLPDGSRAPGWPLNGKAIISAPGDQFQVKLAEDAVGGYWMVWTDSRSGLNQIYFTRLKSDGSPAADYIVGGRALSAAPGSQIDPVIVGDGAGGFFCAWLDNRNGNLDLYGQHIHATGVVVPGWDAGGTALCTEPSPQQDPWLVLSSPNHALVVWSDTRTAAPRYYAMAMPADGAVAAVGPPIGAGLRLATTGSTRELEFTLTASDAGEIRFEVFDASGRRMASQRLQGPLSAQRVRIPTAALRPGLYLARAEQLGATAVSRAVLIP